MKKISLYPYFFLKFFVFFKITIYLYIKKDDTMEVISIILMAVGVIGAIATSHLTGAMLFAKWEKHNKKKEEEDERRDLESN